MQVLITEFLATQGEQLRSGSQKSSWGATLNYVLLICLNVNNEVISYSFDSVYIEANKICTSSAQWWYLFQSCELDS